MFTSVLEAKEYCNSMTNSRLSEADALEKISQLEEYIKNEESESSILLFQEWVSDLKIWLVSDERKRGEYPQGIDQILLDMVEVRAFIFAFQKHPDLQNRLNNSFFWQQWFIGAAHTIISGVGKLVSLDGRDNSLANLWARVGPWIESDGGCDSGEAGFISEVFKRKTGYFDNSRSKAFNYRNKAIAHNENSPEIGWDDLDPDMKILIRAWSLLVAWSSFGILNPFRSNIDVFDSLGSFFSTGELNKLHVERSRYLNIVKGWSKSYLHTGEVDPGRGPFSDGLSVFISTASPPHGESPEH